MPHIKQQNESSEEYTESDSQQQQIAQSHQPKVQRIHKSNAPKKIVMNISMTQYPIVREIGEQFGWKLQCSSQSSNWDIFWTDFAIDPNVLIKMDFYQKINHFPGIHIIARKNLLGTGLMKLRTIFPNQYNFFPLTWMLPAQYPEFRQYYEQKPKGKCRTYIVKPQAQCQGRGIFLTRKIQSLENGKHYVVQRYIARPYLIDGLKFDFRIYVLLSGTDPLKLYLFNEGLVRFSTEKYVEPLQSNLDQAYMHLTNYAINKNNPKFIFNNNANNMSIGHKRSLSSVYKILENNGVNIEVLKQKINDIVVKTIITGLPLMGHQYKCCQPQDYYGNMCFHLLGFDVMLTNTAEPMLIEVNHTPSFTTDTPLDYNIKKKLIKDTLILMNINKENKAFLLKKCKDYNNERLVTGKRHIYEGQERKRLLKIAQQERDQYQLKNLGGFIKIYPTDNQTINSKYENIISIANKTYFQQNCSIRLKREEQEQAKLMKIETKRKLKCKLDKTISKNGHFSELKMENSEKMDLSSTLVPSLSLIHQNSINTEQQIRQQPIIPTNKSKFNKTNKISVSRYANSRMGCINQSYDINKFAEYPLIMSLDWSIKKKIGKKEIKVLKPTKSKSIKNKNQKMSEHQLKKGQSCYQRNNPGGFVVPKVFSITFQKNKKEMDSIVTSAKAKTVYLRNFNHFNNHKNQ